MHISKFGRSLSVPAGTAAADEALAWLAYVHAAGSPDHSREEQAPIHGAQGLHSLCMEEVQQTVLCMLQHK